MDHILIVGTGALACLFGAKMASKGVKVVHLGTWSEGIRALNQTGIQLISDGMRETWSVTASPNPEDSFGAKLALVLVKSWQTERAAAQLASILSPDGVAVTLQNGLGNYETLVAALGEDRVGQGVTTCGATLLGPGTVRSGGEGRVTFGDHPRLKPLINILEIAGLNPQIVPQLQPFLWEKLVINAAINPLTAILRVTNGDVLSDPSARQVMIKIANEVAGTADGLGIPLQVSDPGAVVENVASATALNHSSMLQDIFRGAPTEIDAICGAVVRKAAEIKHPVPTNMLMLHLIQAIVGLKDKRL